MNDGSAGGEVPCPVVELEWDRGHDRREAIVRASSDEGIIVTTVHDHSPTAGHLWVRADEVLTTDELDADDVSVRLADLRGERAVRMDPALTKLGNLLDHVANTGALVLIHLRRTGSAEGLVGRILERTHEQLRLNDVAPNARHSGEVLDYPLDEIIAVEWGSDYLVALDELLVSEKG